VANDGYWGIAVSPSTEYRGSFYARASKDFHGSLQVSLQSDDGSKILARTKVGPVGSDWKKYEFTFKTGKDVIPSQKNRFVISADQTGSFWLSLVSLFPPTYDNRPNGNRIDLMRIIGQMEPAFLRLPGGNYLEGNEIDERFNWYKTIGPLEDRPGHQGPWGYRSSDGMGLLEFLDWCEDLHMDPVLGIYAGYSLHGVHVDPGEKLDPYVREAMDELEYVTGDTSTRWGKERAKDGHPKPFALRYVEIGNEDWFDRSGSYPIRFAQFYDAIKAKYPQMQLISTAPLHTRRPDVVDDHYYHSARWFESNVHHYDNYPRTGPKIFVGEWATQEGQPTPDMNAALGDAAWMTGMERNCDVVIMASYAPLFVNVHEGGRQWGTNLIGYNGLTTFGSPSYYAQRMFMRNRGDVLLPVDLQTNTADMAPPAPSGGIGIATWGTQAEFKDVQVTSGDTTLYKADFSRGMRGWHTRVHHWRRSDDGAIQQTGSDRPDQATTGDDSWTDYTYTLKAKKLSGAEGFLVLFHYQDRNNFIAWNLGGWDNSRSALVQTKDGENTEIGGSSPVTIDTNKWYDIRIELHGREIRCYLDGKLITQATAQNEPAVPAVFATASRDNSDGDVILKVVNASDDAQTLPIKLGGVNGVSKNAVVEMITGNRQDMNSIDNPAKVIPQRCDIHDAATEFNHEFPARSVTVMRVKIK
jgi:alpha-L-arabinofuranosidase